MEIRKLAVVGAGTMGGGIAQLLSYAGYEVVMKDVDQGALELGVAQARRVYGGQVKKGKMNEAEVAAKMALITPTLDYDLLADADLVIEAVPEVMELKKRVFGELDARVKPAAILASNTSSLSVTEMASATSRPERVAGLHFFNPVQVMKLVEVIYAPQTSEETVLALLEFAQTLRKLPVRVKDSRGFLVNRILTPYSLEAVNVLLEGLADARTIDEDARAWGMPMGPLALADMVGLDVSLHVGETMAAAYGERMRPNMLIPEMVAAGRLGQKAGVGFYEHSGDGDERGDGGERGDGDEHKEVPALDSLLEKVRAETPPPEGGRYDIGRVMLRLINEAAYVAGEGVASARDVDIGMMAGTGYSYKGERIGPLATADRLGLDKVLEGLEAYRARYGEAFRPAPLLAQRVRAGLTGEAAGRGFHAYGLTGEGARRHRGEAPGIHLERKGHVAALILDHPPVNALSKGMMKRLGELLDALEEDEGVRALIVAAAGLGLFTAGADVSEFGQAFAGGPAALKESVREGQALFNRLDRFPKPVIAAVAGVAFGGGLELALACDLRVAGASARFALPEISLGILPAWGGTQRLPALIGRARALEMMLTGLPVTAPEAWRQGLVNRVVHDDEVLPEAQRLAEHIASRAPLSAQAILNLTQPSLEEAIGGEVEALAGLATTADVMEGVTAFMQKREPRFEGK
jgi:enoyl-CoA hydratase/3-hydroxyacyl-CoA dehydrogenase